MIRHDQEGRLRVLAERGVVVVDPRQTYIGGDVSLERLQAGAVLYPGTRLEGSKTWLGPQARVGTEGPATLVDAVLDQGTSVASGYAQGVVLLRGASLGGNAHVRPGTLLEEEASTAHCVGLKQTLLLSFVTLGSLINFCDCLMAGGSSRRDHSEVGSGYIHFNFTPWGERGDKATPSLVGDVVEGVFLRQARVFLGGSGGLVGPATVGYGAIAAAGQVWRGSLGAHRLRLEPQRAIDRQLVSGQVDRLRPRADRNVAYIAQIVALREWYEQVRLPRCAPGQQPVLEAAVGVLRLVIEERRKQLDRFLVERGAQPLEFELESNPPCPLDLGSEPQDHVAWVQALPEASVAAGTRWLQSIVDRVLEQGLAGLPRTD